MKRANLIEVPLYLYQAQMRVNELWNLNFQMIDGKHGIVRSKVIGGETNHSGRSVIVLDPTLKIDEVDMPYRAFIEQFKGQILARIIKDKNWTITKATNYLASKFNFDEYVHSVMTRIIEEDGVRIIINRNPTQKKLWDCKSSLNDRKLLRAPHTKLNNSVAIWVIPWV